MTDLSQTPVADLYNAAGIAQPADLSQVPTPDLLNAAKTYEPFNILPFSEDAGGVHFDPTAGLLGNIIRAVKTPGDVLQGKLDPMSPEGKARALDLAMLISPVNPAVRAGDFAVPGVLKNFRQATPTPPTAEALNNAASAGYDAVKATGATYPGEAVGAAARDTISGLQNDGILAELAPQTHSVLNKLSNPPQGSTVTIASLDAARKALGRIGGNFTNPTEQEAARRATSSIDQFIQQVGAAPPVAGAATAPSVSAANGTGASGALAVPTAESEAARLITEARGNAAAAFRSDRITGAADAAELRAAAANSGQNIGNSLRQRLASILLDPKKSRGFSQDELDSIRQVVEGTAGSNTLRHVGNMLGGGGGLGHTLIGTLGAVAGGSLGGVEGAAAGAAALPLLGSGARSTYNSLVSRQVGLADQLIRARSPLYEQMLRNAPYVAQNPAGRNALMRGLLMSAPDENQQGGLLGWPPQR